MLAEMQAQTCLLKRIWWAVVGLGVICLIAFYLNGIKVNISPTEIRGTIFPTTSP